MSAEETRQVGRVGAREKEEELVFKLEGGGKTSSKVVNTRLKRRCLCVFHAGKRRVCVNIKKECGPRCDPPDTKTIGECQKEHVSWRNMLFERMFRSMMNEGTGKRVVTRRGSWQPPWGLGEKNRRKHKSGLEHALQGVTHE